MKSFRITSAALFFGAILAAFLGSMAPAKPSQENSQPTRETSLTGPHDFDVLGSGWKAHHHRLKEGLTGSHEWVEFKGTTSARLLMEGFVDASDSVDEVPAGAYRGVGLSTYDSKTGQWATWALDGRDPSGALDPPLKGHFENGIGTFFSDDTLRGKPIRVRVTWSHITSTSARWEQALSGDGGKTWETNWVTDFRRGFLNLA
ncbi:MAG: hypothetical protein WB630_25460 [Candidatus Acidiferrales bacterium]